MEWTSQNSKLFAGILALMLTASAIGGIYYWDKSGDLAEKNDREVLKADSLLSAKLNLERDKDRLSGELTSVNKDREAIQSKLVTTQKLLSQKNATLNKLRKESKHRQEDLAMLQQQIADLTSMKNNLQSEIERYSTEKNQWLTDRDKFNNATLAFQHQINDLNLQLNAMVPKSALTADNFRVDVLKNNHKVTAKAKKAQSILVSFTLPAALTGEGNQEIYLSLTDSEKTPMEGVLRHLTLGKDALPKDIPIHAVQHADFGRNPQKIVFEFEPSETVKEGVYKADIYTAQAYLGSVEFRLRNSFLFF